MSWQATWNRSVTITGIAAILIVSSAEMRNPVHTKGGSPKDPWSGRIAESFAQFGGSRPGNFCPVIFGPEIVRPDIVELAKVIDAEADERLFRDWAHAVDDRSVWFYAWAEKEPPRVFLTARAKILSPDWVLALLFHEVRGHLELEFSDEQMMRVLCPGAAPGDTHCITRAIVRGCPTLSGSSTEAVLARMGIVLLPGTVTISGTP